MRRWPASAALIILTASAFAAKPTPTPHCGSQTPQPGWVTFVDEKRGFCFEHPSTYHVRAPDVSLTKGVEALAELESQKPRQADATDKGRASIAVWLDGATFDLNRLTRYAPTGVIMPPALVHFGGETFYYYCRGGGGVAYPDLYFFNLRGKTLEFIFDGPYPDDNNSPDEKTQQIEKKRVRDIKVAEKGRASFLGVYFWKYIILPERRLMSEAFTRLEAHRSELLRAIAGLNDMRPGSIVGAVRRCGKPTCHCAQPDDSGHGPSLRITHKRRGKTVTEALPTSAAVRKAEREIAEFRRFQRLSEELVEVSEQICRLRPVEDTLTAQEKKQRKRSSTKRYAR